jgi:hypothetical protein
MNYHSNEGEAPVFKIERSLVDFGYDQSIQRRCRSSQKLIKSVQLSGTVVTCPACYKSVVLRKLQHNEHLIGIELHPGPKVKVMEKVVKVITKRKKKEKKKSRSMGLASLGQDTQAYINCLLDPLNNPPICTGFGSLKPGVLCSAYSRRVVTAVAAATANNMKVMFNPQAGFSSASGTSITNELNYWMTYENYLGTSSVNGVNYPSANNGAIAASFNKKKLIAAALRVSVLFPMTATPPLLFVNRFSGLSSTTSLDSLTPTTLANYPDSTLVPSYGNGIVTSQLIWLPNNTGSFGYNTTTSYFDADGNFDPPCCCISGLDTGMQVFLESIAHYECEIGIASTGIEELNENGNVAKEWPSVEKMWSVVSGILTKSALLYEYDYTRAFNLGKNVLNSLNRFSENTFPGSNSTPRTNLNRNTILPDYVDIKTEAEDVLSEIRKIQLSDTNSKSKLSLQKAEVELESLIQQISTVKNKYTDRKDDW